MAQKLGAGIGEKERGVGEGGGKRDGRNLFVQRMNLKLFIPTSQKSCFLYDCQLVEFSSQVLTDRFAWTNTETKWRPGRAPEKK